MGRITKQDMDASTTSSKAKDKKPAKTTTPFKLSEKVLIYDKAGNECEHLPEDQIMAKAEQTSIEKLYYIRTNQRKEPYNANDKDFVAEAYRIGRLKGVVPHILTKCSQGAFANYVKFLQTNNRSFLDSVQRGM